MTYQTMVRKSSVKEYPANEELVSPDLYGNKKERAGCHKSRWSASGATNTIKDDPRIRQGVQTLTDNLYLAQSKE